MGKIRRDVNLKYSPSDNGVRRTYTLITTADGVVLLFSEKHISDTRAFPVRVRSICPRRPYYGGAGRRFRFAFESFNIMGPTARSVMIIIVVAAVPPDGFRSD